MYGATRMVIANHSDAKVKPADGTLLAYTDENGQVDEVSGPGVIESNRC